MEYLDVYNENHEMIGTYPRDEVHEKGMWHNTIHCWLYDNESNVYFQVRSDDNKLYTTSSGHVQAGESLKEAFGREVMEEIGVKVGFLEAELVKINHWKMDKEKNGKITKDRAFSHIYILNIKCEPKEFNFSDGEVNGIVKLNSEEVLRLFKDEVKEISGVFIDEENVHTKKTFSIDDFLLWNGEIAMEKYGYIMEAIKRK